MYGLQTILDIEARATREARKEKKRPLAISPTDTQTTIAARGGIPFLGSYVPKGCYRTDREPFFVDISGFGAPGEPALTIDQFIAETRPGFVYALISHGQFQGHVAEYEYR